MKAKGLEPAQPVRLPDLVAYQEGAIVSRTLLQRPEGTVTLFAFAAGESLSEHTAPYDALLYVLEGDLEVTIAGVPHRLGENALILLPAHQPHAVRALANTKVLLIMIRARV